MSFSTTERIIALAPDLIGALFPALLADYGEPLPDGDREIPTIGANWDDSEHTRLRAASLYDGTIIGQPLTDGRVAFSCLWQSDLEAQFLANGMAGVSELTDQQYQSLLPIIQEL